jgi:hypothetical protein
VTSQTNIFISNDLGVWRNKLNLLMQIRVLDHTLAWQFRARAPTVAKCPVVIDVQRHRFSNGFMTRLLFAVIGLISVLLSTAYSADAPKKRKGSSANASPLERKPVHLVVRSAAEIKQIFTYSPYPAVPSELEGYAGSQVGGTGTYRLTVDAQGAVTQVTILKGFTVTAVYAERFSDVKGNTVPALDKVMVQALMRWRAKPGPMRVVDIYWSFGTRPWVNYGKSSAAE